MNELVFDSGWRLWVVDDVDVADERELHLDLEEVEQAVG